MFQQDKPNMRRHPQQTRAQVRIDKILDAAAEVFAEVGYESATTNLIAKRANTSIGSLYRFFPDKFAIFQGLAVRYDEQLKQLLSQALISDILSAPIPTLIDRSMDAFERFLRSEPAFEATFVFADAYPELKATDRRLKGEAAQFIASFIGMRNPALSSERRILIARTCVETLAAFLRAATAEKDELLQAQNKAEFKAMICAYLELSIPR